LGKSTTIWGLVPVNGVDAVQHGGGSWVGKCSDWLGRREILSFLAGIASRIRREIPRWWGIKVPALQEKERGLRHGNGTRGGGGVETTRERNRRSEV